jgi:hypothetical protein
MRVLRLLLVAIFSLFAVAVGMIATAAVSMITASILFARRKLRPVAPSRATPRVQPRHRNSNPGDVIDVTATEVRVE